MQDRRTINLNPMFFFGGLLLGAIFTALYTPKSGTEMRNKLKATGDQLGDELSSQAKDFKDKADRMKETVGNKLTKTGRQNNDKNNPSNLTPPTP